MNNPLMSHGKWDFVTQNSLRECILRHLNEGQLRRIYDPNNNQRFIVVEAKATKDPRTMACDLYPADVYGSHPNYDYGKEPTLQTWDTPIISTEIRI